jgi:hypothetical protein
MSTIASKGTIKRYAAYKKYLANKPSIYFAANMPGNIEAGKRLAETNKPSIRTVEREKAEAGSKKARVAKR